MSTPRAPVIETAKRMTAHCDLCGVDVLAEAIPDPARCLDGRCPLKPKE